MLPLPLIPRTGRLTRPALLSLLVLGACLARGATAASLKVELAPNYATGTYGGDSRTDSYEMPLKLKWTDGPWTASIRIPYLQVTGPQSAVPGVGIVGSPSGTPVRGLGDIRLYGGARVLGGGDDSLFDLELGAGTKLPTGNASLGLGSGQVGLAAQAVATLNPRPDLSAEVTFGRFFRTRRPNSLGLVDFFYSSTSIDWDMTPTITVGATLDVLQTAVAGGGPVVEAGPFIEYQIAPGTRIGVNVLGGMTRDSSTFGVGLLFSRRFAL